MKKKIFFIISSLNAGGAEKVFWLLSQHFDKDLYQISIILLNGKKMFFSSPLNTINIINLNTQRASLSFFKLFRLLRAERPDAIYTTGGQINALVGFTSFFIHTSKLIARPANVADAVFESIKSKLIGSFMTIFYRRFDSIICQSEEIKTSLLEKYKLSPRKMIVIPNPVLPAEVIRKPGINKTQKQLIIVGRLAKQKGHERLLDLFKYLPENYSLTIAGDGVLRTTITEKIKSMALEDRVTLSGLVSGVTDLVAQHDLFVLPSYFEGFPNAVIESLSVGTPVVAFKVGGITAMIKNDFNGYIVEQGDLEGFKLAIIKATHKSWNYNAIKEDIIQRFSISTIVNQYQKLIA